MSLCQLVLVSYPPAPRASLSVSVLCLLPSAAPLPLLTITPGPPLPAHAPLPNTFTLCSTVASSTAVKIHPLSFPPSHPRPPPQARLSASMWGGGGYYPLLPWSCIVLESVPEASLVAFRSRPAGSPPPKMGGPPTPEDIKVSRVGVACGWDGLAGWMGVVMMMSSFGGGRFKNPSRWGTPLALWTSSLQGWGRRGWCWGFDRRLMCLLIRRPTTPLTPM